MSKPSGGAGELIVATIVAVILAVLITIAIKNGPIPALPTPTPSTTSQESAK